MHCLFQRALSLAEFLEFTLRARVEEGGYSLEGEKGVEAQRETFGFLAREYALLLRYVAR